jgi:protein SCO1
MISKRHLNSLLVFFAAQFVVVSCGSDSSNSNARVLPILGERDVEYVMRDGQEVADTIYHKVPEFEYINQDSIRVTSKSLKDKIWVADFFFSHCPSICPPMTANMKRLSIKTKDLEDRIQFLSFSIDPDRDTPERLREYIKQYGIEASNWHFFTGDEEETHLLAKEFFNGAERDDEVDGGFGHTSYFAIVDTEGYVRGIYDGTNSKQVDKLEKDLRKLLEHEYKYKGSK